MIFENGMKDRLKAARVVAIKNKRNAMDDEFYELYGKTYRTYVEETVQKAILDEPHKIHFHIAGFYEP